MHGPKDFTVSVKNPNVQLMHAVDGSASWSDLPAAQSVHALEPLQPAALCVPALQLVHAVLASLSKSASPAAQSVHALEPAAAYLPALQSAHVVA